MEYTVKQLSKIAGVSVRTLHHYDAINLLKPAFFSKNGYRIYEYEQVLKLQTILFYKELKFSLSQIKEILLSDNYNQVDALKQQKKLLLLKQNRLSEIIKTLTKTIQSLEEEHVMTGNELFESLDEETIEAYKAEAKERWGHTSAYKQSMSRTQSWSKEKMTAVKKEGESIILSISKVMDSGYNSPQVQTEIKRYHQHMNRFYDCSHQMFAGLGEMYVQDSRFTEVYEKVATGLAKFMRAAMAYYRDTVEE